jgi:hypothetical protein
VMMHNHGLAIIALSMIAYELCDAIRPSKTFDDGRIRCPDVHSQMKDPAWV